MLLLENSSRPTEDIDIFCGSGLFKNKYELFEWMLEARRKGITNPRAIRSYARQKEMSIYGT